MTKHTDDTQGNVVTLRGAAAKEPSWSAEKAQAWFTDHARQIIDYEWRASFSAREEARKVPTVSSLHAISSRTSSGSTGLSITKPEPSAEDTKVTSLEAARSDKKAGRKGQKKE